MSLAIMLLLAVTLAVAAFMDYRIYRAAARLISTLRRRALNPD